jgi:DNA-binding SARP family transcriptional activator
MVHLLPAEYPPAQLSLFGGFTLHVTGRRVLLPRHARRVLAYLALVTTRTNDVDRRLLAQRLWPDSPADRSAASLRTALWRIRKEDDRLLHTDRERVSLGRGVAVDAHRFRCLITRNHSTQVELQPEELQTVIDAVDLLPAWDEDWLLLAREQMRQMRLTALESAAHRLSGQGRFLEVIDLMLTVIAGEPFRESAHAMLIDAHLGQGNMADARWHLLTFARDLWSELNVHPSPELLSKIGISSGRLTHFLSA